MLTTTGKQSAKRNSIQHMRRKNGYEPQPVRLGHTFAILMEREGFVELCHNDRTVETQPAATIDLFETFPPEEEKTCLNPMQI